MAREVAFDDAQGRKVLFRLNTAGHLDFYVDGRQKVQQVKQLRVDGSTLRFEGKKLLCSEACASLPKEQRAELVEQVMALSAQATTPVNAMRCFVEVKSASGLRAADIGFSSDPYCICGISGKFHTRDRTKFRSRTLNPKWNEKLEIQDYKVGEDLEFIVMDHDYMTKDDFLGYAKVTGEQLSSRSFEGELTLIDDGKHGSAGRSARGKLVVRVHLEPDDDGAEAAAEAGLNLEDRQLSQGRMRTGTLTRSRANTGRSQTEAGALDVMSEEELAELTALRAGLAEQVFDALDEKKKGVLSSAKVRALAAMLGFSGNDAAWDIEFQQVAAKRSWNAEAGVTKAQLASMFDDEQGPASCSNGVLEDLVEELRRQTAEGVGDGQAKPVVHDLWKCAPETQAFLDQTPRDRLIAAVFELLDTRRDGYLTKEEMMKYASLFGFDGSDEEWAIEYKCMAREYGFKKDQGIDIKSFAAMTNNHSDGAYASDDDIRRAIEALRQGEEASLVASRFAANRAGYMLRKETLEFRAKLPMRDLVATLFKALDINRVGYLGPDEVRRYAEMCGFTGDDEEWAVEWAEICHTYNINPKRGADPDQFLKIVNGKAGQSRATGASVVDQIEYTKETRSRTATSRSAATSRTGRKLTKQETWQPIGDKFQVLRHFSLFIREAAADPDSAFALFTTKRFGRLSREEFFAGLDKNGYRGDKDEIFKLLALASNCVVKKHFKWVWNLLDAEELVLDRARRRAQTAKSLADIRSRVNTEAYADERAAGGQKGDQGITAEELIPAMS